MAEIGASASLLDAPAKVASQEQRSLGLGGGAFPSCPEAAIQGDARDRPSRVDSCPSSKPGGQAALKRGHCFWSVPTPILLEHARTSCRLSVRLQHPIDSLHHGNLRATRKAARQPQMTPERPNRNETAVPIVKELVYSAATRARRGPSMPSVSARNPGIYIPARARPFSARKDSAGANASLNARPNDATTLIAAD